MFSLILSLMVAGSGSPGIDGPEKIDEHRLARFSAVNVPPKAGMLWRVSPAAKVDRATSPRGTLEFVAPPGEYTVELLLITQDESGAFIITELSKRVRIGTASQPPPKGGTADPVAATGRIRFGSAGCTATVIGRRSDGRWDIVTAAHCIRGRGDRGTITLRDGRSFAVTVATAAEGPDVAWLVTDRADIDAMPHADLANALPDRGTAVWHNGYGVDRPENREDGEVLGQSSNGQTAFHLSVSPGDSGGGIFRSDTGELVGVVCCTRTLARKTTMWGCSAVTASQYRPK